MLMFLLAVLLLVLGYAVYGRFADKVFGVNEKAITPAFKINDGVDYVPMKTSKIFLIQFLNIAGLGPVFGAIFGALYGPVVLLWIVFGSIFAGGVHDYLTARISMKFNGKSSNFIVEKFFGKTAKNIFIIFITVFLFLAGAIFAMSPAQMLADMSNWSFLFWIMAVFAYYFIATLLPIDKIIGKIYPYFAVLLIFVTVFLCVLLFSRDLPFYPNLTNFNQHPQELSIFPLMFVTVACGALSGFHSTQVPMMARCITNEKYARRIFYGAMIAEGLVALIWATLGIAFYQGSTALQEVVSRGGPGLAVAEIAKGLSGNFGAILIVLSVVVLSITTGDTIFRSARLILADNFKINQKSIIKRLILSLVVLSCGIALCFFDLSTVWLYFGWSNQLLATLMLWVISIYLRKHKKFYFISLLPALLMTMVCADYIFIDKLGLALPYKDALYASMVVTLAMAVMFFRHKVKK